MESLKDKRVLVSGASMAGLSTAYCLNKLGYKVTVVEMAGEIRNNGAAIDIHGEALEATKRMGIFEQLLPHRLQVEKIEFKNADDITEGSMNPNQGHDESTIDNIEIERDKFTGILFNHLKNDAEFIFNNSITALNETQHNVKATFKDGSKREFDLVVGCDGMHSGVRRLCFGDEKEYAHFLQAYFSITIVNKLLVPQKTLNMFNVPDKCVMLNAYNNKTDIIFCFFSENEIPYDYRDEQQQREIILKQFAGEGWRTPELLKEVQRSKYFYFDKFCQIKMPSWTKGRVALAGDAAYCASPAAGMGGSLAVLGAATLADALQKHNGNFELAFQEYNTVLRPFIEEIQAMAEKNVRESFIPRTEEAIRKRNIQGF